MKAWAASAALLLACLPLSAHADKSDDLAREALGQLIGRENAAAQIAWSRCTETAVDRFALQREPAETVVTAAFGACIDEEIKLMQLGKFKYAASLYEASRPALLARVMAIRSLQKR